MRKWIVAIAVGLFVLVAAALSLKLVSAKVTPTPPKLEIAVAGAKIPVVLGSYCWGSGLKRVCADAPSPDELLKGLSPTVVSLSKDHFLKLSFGAAPEELTVNWWVGQKQFTEPLGRPYTRNYGFEAMTVPGVYPICFSATWKRGEADYCLKIETRAD